MRHRLYYLLPDVESARRVRDDMLLNRIEYKRLHFLTGGTSLPQDLPEANVLHKTDVIHGAESGMIVGTILGIVVGVLLVFYFEMESKSTQAIVILGATVVGLFFGGWAASLVAAALPNTRLKTFYPELEKGKILMIADVPARRVEEIERMLADRHPEMRFSGEEPNIPIFP